MELFYLYYDEEVHSTVKPIIKKYESGIMSMYTEVGKIAFFDQEMYESMKEDLNEINIEYYE